MSDKLKDKVAIVTGGGRGIGRAITQALATEGANVVIASRKMEVLEAAAAEMADLPGRIVPVPCHVGKADQIQACVEKTVSELGGVDIMVNNSATNVAQGPTLEVTDEAFDKMVEVNAKAPLRFMRLVVPQMAQRGGGSIINISSVAGINPQPYGMAYSFTKAGLNMMTRSWAREFGALGVRVNTIAPGLIQTDFSEYFWKDDALREQVVGGQPLARLGQPEDIGATALYLASSDSSFVTGQLFVVDGGATA